MLLLQVIKMPYAILKNTQIYQRIVALASGCFYLFSRSYYNFRFSSEIILINLSLIGRLLKMITQQNTSTICCNSFTYWTNLLIYRNAIKQSSHEMDAPLTCVIIRQSAVTAQTNDMILLCSCLHSGSNNNKYKEANA